MGDRLKGKVAVVTGAGRGIGRGIALALAAEGARVVVNDLGVAPDGTAPSSEPANEVVAEIKASGGVAVANYDSAATVEGGENIIKSAVDNFGRIDILMNNAVSGNSYPVWDMPVEEWDKMINVALSGYFYCIKPAVPFMKRQRFGRIISMTSGAFFMGYYGAAHFAAAKGGVTGFTYTYALELGKYGITVNAISPGAATRQVVHRRRAEVEMGLLSQEEAALQAERTPMRPPEDVAPIVVYLATDAAANINGHIFGATGGQISLYSRITTLKSIHKDGRWTLDELSRIMPTTLAAGLVNPAPPAP